MKIKIMITKEYDTEGDDHGHLFEGVKNPVELALRYFAEDLDRMNYDETKRQAFVSIDK